MSKPLLILILCALCSVTGSANDEDLQRKLRTRLKEDLEAPQNTRANSVMSITYGDSKPAIGSPQQLFQNMVPPSYRVYMLANRAIHQLEFEPEKSVYVSDETFTLVDSDLSGALDAAIDLMISEPVKTARLAAEILRRRRSHLTVPQWKRIVEAYRFVPSIRNQYPAGVDVDLWGSGAVPFGFLLLVDVQVAGVETEIRSLLDGKVIATASGGGWRSNLPAVFLAKLSLGDHVVEYQLDYKLVVGGQVTHGKATSGGITIQIVPEQANRLAAQLTDEQRDEILSSIKALPIEKGRERTYSRSIGDGKFEPTAKLRIPYLELQEPLAVALAMKVDVYFEGSAKPHSRPDWIVPAGETNLYELEGMIGDGRLIEVLSARADENGYVDARVVLTPSRSAALSHALIESYYAEPIEIQARWQLLWTESGER